MKKKERKKEVMTTMTMIKNLYNGLVKLGFKLGVLVSYLYPVYWLGLSKIPGYPALIFLWVCLGWIPALLFSAIVFGMLTIGD